MSTTLARRVVHVARESAPGPTGGHLLVAGLASLSGMTPKRLRRLLRLGPPERLWAEVAAAKLRAPDRVDHRAWQQLLAQWSRQVERLPLEAVQRRYATSGVRLLLPTDAEFPQRLRDDRANDPAEVLFVQGDPFVAHQKRVVGIVGTRRPTSYGIRVALDLGQKCAEAGMVVASGLALGIDGAAHRGALRAPNAQVLGVIGSGIDRPYPRQHHGLYQGVAQQGVILSESPLGGPPLAENFPDRNRLLAALARVLVVVESPVGGGSLITYRLAVERGSTVMAVPGSIHSPMSAGPNGLLNEALPCRDVRDVEVAMGWALADLARPSEPRPEPSAIGSRTLASMGWDPVTVDELVDRVGAGIGTVTLALAQLEADRWVERTNGRWQRLAGRS